MSIKEQVQKIKKNLVEYPNVRIVAATKYLDVEKTKEVIKAGINEIGENRTDAFLEKYEAFADEQLVWHFFGVLQARKVRYVIDKIDYLHSLDNISLANEINKRRTTPLKCFVQVNISGDPNKSGLDEAKVVSFVKTLAKYDKIQIVGLMTIAKMTFEEEVLEKCFARMQKIQENVQKLNLAYAPCTELSMGMSNDYLLAVKHGATMVRLGRILLK